MAGNDLRAQLDRHLGSLPVLPGVLLQLLTLDRRDADYPGRVIALVETEPNFAARVLAAANSPSSAPARPIESVAGAVTRVGANGATDLVLSLGVASVFVPRDDWDRSLWRHALQVAIASRALAVAAPASGVHPDVVYTAGLLHDVGRFILFQHAPAELRRIDEGTWSTPQELVAAEIAICGLDHAELGAAAAERWGIPSTVVNVVRWHHVPPNAGPGATEQRMIEIVHLADLLMFPSAALNAESPSTRALAEAAHRVQPAWLRLDVDALERIIDTVQLESTRQAEVIGL